ncbi:BA75_02332T0 [Komagataella pastoris]|uniref:Altered inheritance of mitochondria protein 32 n=1 Tax=Komagataella pastoris TaxID=4922 RepID=A0A1B2JBT7_PICPA|nr:BA75_02332T0 [Komagataella pastoris]
MNVRQEIQKRCLTSSSKPTIPKILESFRIVEKCPDPTFNTGCTYCRPQFPKDKAIEFNKPLNNTKPRVWKHLLVHTNEVDGNKWPSRIELAPGTFAASILPLRKQIQSPFHPVLISNIALEAYHNPNQFKVVLFPDNLIYYIQKDKIQRFTELYLNPGADAHEVAGIDWEKNMNGLILICGHTQRDERCGIIAPLLKEEFEIVLKTEGLLYNKFKNPKGIKVGVISHVGGHAFAGNVIYFNTAGQSIWYGRVFPDKVQGIVNQTVKNKNIIKELYRGQT